MLKKILLGCGVVSSALYVTADVVASLRYDGYRYADQNFSELLADGAPTRPLMLALAVAPYSALVTAFGAGVWMAGGNRRARITGALLIGYALAGAAGGWLFRMDAREVLAAGEGDWRNSLHVPATMVGSLLLLAGMASGSRLLGQSFRWYTYATIATLLLFGAVTSLQAGRLVANEATPWMGITERVNIYATMLWVAVLSVSLLRSLGDGGQRESKSTAVPAPMLQR